MVKLCKSWLKIQVWEDVSHYTNILLHKTEFNFYVPPQQSNICQPAIFHNEILDLRLCKVVLLMKYAFNSSHVWREFFDAYTDQPEH